jgi:cytochrome c551/c552
MSRYQPQSWTLLIVLAIVIGTLAGVAAVRADDAPDGKAIFLAQKCDMCHAVSTAGIEAKVKSAAMQGPDLVDLDLQADWMTKYLKKEVDKDGKAHKKAFSGSDEELRTLIDWLLAQKKS